MLLVWLLAFGSGCRAHDSESDPGQQLRARLGLKEGQEIHRVILGGRGAREHIVPAQVDLEQGDVVEFSTVDHRVHFLRFPEDSVAAQAWAFLVETGQDQSPPLVERGARFVVTFEGAPPGRYPFLSRGGGGVLSGVITVRLSPPD